MSLDTGITVIGFGTADLPPDEVTVDVGVSVLADTAAEARARAARSANALIEALVTAGVTRESIRTLGYSLAPEYEWTEKGRRTLGFRAVNTVRAQTKDTDRSGALIDAVAAAVGDDGTVSGLRFSLSDLAGTEAAARSVAWADAIARATQLAELAGRRLGAAVEIFEPADDAGLVPMPRARLAMEAADGSTPVEGGTQTVTCRLRVRFDLED